MDSSGSSSSKVSRGPDTTSDSSPAATTRPLPLTGAARNAVPRAAARARTSADASADTVEQSTRNFGALAGLPSSRSVTEIRSAESATMVKTTSRSAR